MRSIMTQDDLTEIKGRIERGTVTLADAKALVGVIELLTADTGPVILNVKLCRYCGASDSPEHKCRKQRVDSTSYEVTREQSAAEGLLVLKCAICGSEHGPEYKCRRTVGTLPVETLPMGWTKFTDLNPRLDKKTP